MEKNHKDDSQNEGRDKYMVDIDRMTNEGLAGGTVNEKKDNGYIEEAHEFPKEDPPNKAE